MEWHNGSKLGSNVQATVCFILRARLHQTLDQELHERCQAVGLKSVTGTESNPLHGIWQIRTCSTRSCSALHFLLSHLVTSSHILCLFIAQWWRRKGTSCMMQTGSIRGTSQCAQYPCYPEKANRLTESKPCLLRLQNSGKQMG